MFQIIKTNKQINKLFLENKKPPNKIIILNSLVFIASSSILIYSVNKYINIELLTNNFNKN